MRRSRFPRALRRWPRSGGRSATCWRAGRAGRAGGSGGDRRGHRAALAADRIGLAAHRSIVQAAIAYRHAGLTAPPLQRFAGKLGPGEALLWPAQVRVPARRAGARAPGLILVSAEAGSTASAAGAEGGARVTFPTAADFAGLVRYVEASGATEVALVNAPGDALAVALRGRGIDAYTLGPPRQIELFAA